MFDRKAYHKKYYLEHKDKILEKNRLYAKTHKEIANKRGREFYKKHKQELLEKYKTAYNPVHSRDNHIRKKYGISSKEYDLLFMKQNGKCAICGIHQSKLRLALHIDHDHKTGKVRGLLCGNHNRALGMVHDNIEDLKAMIEYLEKHK